MIIITTPTKLRVLIFAFGIESLQFLYKINNFVQNLNLIVTPEAKRLCQQQLMAAARLVEATVQLVLFS